MKMIAMILPALMIGSMALAQGEPAAPAAPAAASCEASATAKEAKKCCKGQASGDKKAWKACMKSWKKGHASTK